MDTLYDEIEHDFHDTVYIVNHSTDTATIVDIRLLDCPFTHDAGGFSIASRQKPYHTFLVDWDFHNDQRGPFVIAPEDSVPIDYEYLGSDSPLLNYTLRSDTTVDLSHYAPGVIDQTYLQLCQVSATFEVSFSSQERDTIVWDGFFKVVIDINTRPQPRALTAPVAARLFTNCKVMLYDIQGRLVRVLGNGLSGDSGERLAAGVNFAVVKGPEGRLRTVRLTQIR
jgi:hypothetical protein